MNSNFTDKNMILTYLQIMLKEKYNPNTMINSEYYKNIYNNYGFAHFIAKYLNTMYPPMDNSYSPLPNAEHNAEIERQDNERFNNIKQPTDCISILNYFLCSNNGKKLRIDDVYDISLSEADSVYKQIYSNDVCALFDIYDAPLQMTYEKLTATDPETEKPLIQSSYYNKLVNKINNLNLRNTITNIAKKERCYYLYNWTQPKEICEIDDFILSYLLGRTITPYSSMEDIYYVQKLMIGDTVANKDRGVWNSESGNLTDIIIKYQKNKIDVTSTYPVFVTGYFDIFTEAVILKDRGEQKYGIRGL